MTRIMILTLASNKKSVAVSIDNIAFAIEVELEVEGGNTQKFTRVYLKTVIMEDESKWIDVEENPEEISQRANKRRLLR